MAEGEHHPPQTRGGIRSAFVIVHQHMRCRSDARFAQPRAEFSRVRQWVAATFGGISALVRQIRFKIEKDCILQMLLPIAIEGVSSAACVHDHNVWSTAQRRNITSRDQWWNCCIHFGEKNLFVKITIKPLL